VNFSIAPRWTIDLRYRRNEANIRSRQLGVYFENLRVVGLGRPYNWQPTIYSYLNPMNILLAIQNYRHPPLRDILRGFDGVVRPGEMLRELLFILSDA
jgi:ATP-binding cassette, subfamily G (WHITE), member 2, SNQ2